MVSDTYSIYLYIDSDVGFLESRSSTLFMEFYRFVSFYSRLYVHVSHCLRYFYFVNSHGSQVSTLQTCFITYFLKGLYFIRPPTPPSSSIIIFTSIRFVSRCKTLIHISKVPFHVLRQLKFWVNYQRGSRI